MAVKTKSPRKKRDLLIPFEGEEKFVVPKRGGFGQPDMEGYVMVTGLDIRQTTLDAPTTTATSGTGTDAPTRNTTTMLTQASTLGTMEGGGGGGGGTTSTTTSGTTTATPTLTPPTRGNLGTIQTTISGYGTTTTPSTTTPTIPTDGTLTQITQSDTPIAMPSDWSTVSCSDLSSWIDRLTTLTTDRRAITLYTTRVRNIYAANLEQARIAYQTNCPVRQAPLPPPPITPVIPVVPITPAPVGGGGGAIGGGGGGGGSMGDEGTATDQTTITEEKKESGVSWLLILAVLGGIYLLARK